MERKRVDHGKKYWIVTPNASVIWRTEWESVVDDGYFKIGNYFNSKEDAEVVAEKFKEILKEETQVVEKKFNNLFKEEPKPKSENEMWLVKDQALHESGYEQYCEPKVSVAFLDGFDAGYKYALTNKL